MKRQLDLFFEEVTRLVFVSDPPEKADAIFIPGSSRHGPLQIAARLYHEGYAPVIIPSGKYGINKDSFRIPGFETEADWMREIGRAHV